MPKQTKRPKRKSAPARESEEVQSTSPPPFIAISQEPRPQPPVQELPPQPSVVIRQEPRISPIRSTSPRQVISLPASSRHTTPPTLSRHTTPPPTSPRLLSLRLPEKFSWEEYGGTTKAEGLILKFSIYLLFIYIDDFFFLDNQRLRAEIADLQGRNAELQGRNAQLENEVQIMQQEIDALIAINRAFGEESDNQKKEIEELQRRLDEVSESDESEESEIDSELNSESYAESSEVPKKGRRVQPSRQAKAGKQAEESEEARVLF